jgi:FdhE protein
MSDQLRSDGTTRGSTSAPVSKRRSAASDWQRGIERASELEQQFPFAAEILRFYIPVARFQQRLYRELNADIIQGGQADSTPSSNPFAEELPKNIVRTFSNFISVVEENGTTPLREFAHELRALGAEEHYRTLAEFWHGTEGGGTPNFTEFFARAFLQPYAVEVRLRSDLKWNGPVPFACPFCKRKPALGVLRPLGDGGQRSLVCSLCLAEWEFRRIVCPACGEEDHKKLPVYSAEELKHVRVDACESCRSYIKVVDMTKSGRSEPIVDEIASIPLDVWARKQGYAKLQLNLMQL